MEFIMKRDMELVRKILLALEAAPDSSAAWNLSVEGYPNVEVAHHCWLIKEEGLAKGSDVTHKQSPNPEARLTCLTPAGHDFLEDARDDNRWSQAMATVKSAGGSLTIKVVGTILSRLALKAVGLT